MFPSSGLFNHINCPFSRRGFCERPHCLYKHATESRETFGGLYESAVVDLKGNQCVNCYTPVNDNSLHELERLDKEIETARHEVEQEQRRLSSYQNNQVDESSGKVVTKSEANVSYGFSSSKDHKSQVQGKKYVVDNSKPRTDLEYDPLSNFFAALGSYKEQKVKGQQDGKSSRSDNSAKNQSTSQAQMYRPPSQEILDDSTEDGVLVIDVSLSPDDKTSDPMKTSQNSERDLKRIKTVKVLFDFPPQKMTTKLENAASSFASSSSSNKVPDCFPMERNPVLSTFDKTKDYSSDLTGGLEELKGERKNTAFQSLERVKKRTASASFSTPSDESCLLSNAQIDLNRNVEENNPQSNNSVFGKRPDPSHQLKRPASKETLKTDRGNVQSHSSYVQNKPAVVRDVEETTTANLKAFIKQKMAGAAPDSSQTPSQNVPPVNLRDSETCESTGTLLQKDEAVIIISSSPERDDDAEDEVSCSDMELSDSDPMEECYRIFMEANDKEKGNEEQCATSVGANMDVEKPEVKATAPNLTGKKRVAHEVKNLELPPAKVRPQPQVLVPLREPGAAASGFCSRPSIGSRVQQVHQTSSMLTALVKAGRNLVSSVNSLKKPETQTVPCALTPTLKDLQPSTAQNAYLNYIPLGNAVTEVGNDLHLILPQGTFPLSAASTSSLVASVLTPVSRVHPNPNVVKTTNSPAAFTPLPRYRSTAPVIIAAPTRRTALNTAFGSTSLPSTVGASSSSQAAAQAAVKLVPAKRRLKQQSEAPKEKVPHDVRQRYVNMFTEEFLKTTADVNEAFEKALMEEKSVYNRSVNKLKYLSIAVNALKRLKNQSATVKNEKQTQSQRPKGNIPFNRRKIKLNEGDMMLYEILKGYTLTDEQMTENDYPVQHPEKPGSAVLFSDRKVSTDPLKRICCRCGATYSVNKTGKHLRREECNYHYGKGVTNRVPGGVETRYSCCQGVMGAPGCQIFKLHVHDFLSLDGFVSTQPRCSSDTSCAGVYSLDCEMCYTIQGLELSRVTVINSNLQVIYDTFVRPDNEIIDYNTRFSGISEEDVKSNYTSLMEVRDTLLSFISADTILVGHSLETDLCLLKLLHGTVVDTSVVFPHRLGPPNKLSLNTLTAEYLRRIIQESVCGHDTAEDASACMELMLWKMKEDGKLKK